MNIVAPKIGDLQMAPYIKMAIFSEIPLNISIKFQ
jgi:hypothetical protein